MVLLHLKILIEVDMTDNDNVHFYVQINKTTYDEIEELLNTHNNYLNKEGKHLREIIRRVAAKLLIDVSEG